MWTGFETTPVRRIGAPVGRHVLVTLADSINIDQAMQLFASAYLNGNWSGEYLLLAHRIPEASQRWFRTRGILLREYELPLNREEWDRAGADPRLSPVCLLKYYLSGPDFRRWDTVLYVDADVIVAGDLGRFTRVRRFAAVPEMSVDLCGQFHARRDTRSLLASSYPGRRESFNFGVFSLRPSALESDTFASLCRMSIEWLAHAAYPEQSIANLFFSSGWERLPYRLNYNPLFMNRFGVRFPVLLKLRHARELVYHFYGPSKPWHHGHPFRSLWLRNLRLAQTIPDFSRAGPRACVRTGGELAHVLLELVICWKKWTRRLRHLIGGTLRRIRS